MPSQNSPPQKYFPLLQTVLSELQSLSGGNILLLSFQPAEVCRPYFTELHETLKEIARENTDFSSIYAKESSNNKTCYVVIAGDRGLAGGYNANLFKCLEASAEGKDYMVLPVGKKAVEYFRQREIEALTFKKIGVITTCKSSVTCDHHIAGFIIRGLFCINR